MRLASYAPAWARRPARLLGWLVSGLVFAAGGSAARADGTYVKAGGGTVVPLKNHDVRLAAETIDIAVERPGLMADDDTLVVTVTYTFVNDTAKSLNLTMGFPVAWDYREQYMQGEGYLDRERHSPVSDFTTLVDGKAVAVQAKPRTLPPLKPQSDEERMAVEEPSRPAKKDPFGADQYYLWRVAFKPHQTRTVVNRFRYDAGAGVYWKENDFKYILRSGAAWRGPIGRAVVRFRLGDRGCLRDTGGGPDPCIAGLDEPLRDFREDPFEFPDVPAGVGPGGAERILAATGETEFVWEFEAFEPDFDLEWAYDTARPVRKAVRAAIAALDLKAASPADLGDARDTLLAIYGLGFADAARQAEFEKRSWYVRDPRATREQATKDPLLQAVEAELAKRAAGVPPDAAPADAAPHSGAAEPAAPPAQTPAP